jgi:hypothetical protein
VSIWDEARVLRDCGSGRRREGQWPSQFGTVNGLFPQFVVPDRPHRRAARDESEKNLQRASVCISFTNTRFRAEFTLWS